MNLINIVTACSFVLVSNLCLASESAKSFSFSQYPLSEIKASYSISVEGIAAKIFVKQSALGDGISYGLTKCEDLEWLLTQNLIGGMKIESKIDAAATIISERIYIELKKDLEDISKPGSPENFKSVDKKSGVSEGVVENEATEDSVDEREEDQDELIHRKEKKKGWWPFGNSGTEAEDRSSGKEKIASHLESLTVSLDNDPLFGMAKTLGFRWADGKTRDSLISPDEVVTSFLQIAVWAGTIKDLPRGGQKVRWCFEGNPYPMIVKDESVGGDTIFSIYRGETIATEKNKDDVVFKFIFTGKKEGFSMPNKIKFSPDPKTVLVFSEKR